MLALVIPWASPLLPFQQCTFTSSHVYGGPMSDPNPAFFGLSSWPAKRKWSEPEIHTLPPNKLSDDVASANLGMLRTLFFSQKDEIKTRGVGKSRTNKWAFFRVVKIKASVASFVCYFAVQEVWCFNHWMDLRLEKHSQRSWSIRLEENLGSIYLPDPGWSLWSLGSDDPVSFAQLSLLRGETPSFIWATASLCELGKNRGAPLSAETLQNEIHTCKRDRKIQSWPVSRTRSERDQNEIGTRYEFA